MSIRRIVPIEEADWRIASPPDWVEKREPDWHFTPPDGYPVAFLLIDEQQDVATQAFALRTLRQPLTHAAVQALGQVEIEFDPAAHRLLIHELAVWRKGADGVFAKRSLATRETFLIRQREQQLEQQMLNGRASVVALIEDLRVGDAIEMAWTLEPRDALPGLRFTAFHAFVWSVPVTRAFFTLNRDDPPLVKWIVHMPTGAVAPVENVSPGRVTWSLEKPGIHLPEPNTPGWHWPFPVLDVSGWESWAEVADFVAALWADALDDGAEAVAEEAARLRVEGAALTSLRSAIRFVQEDVRYLAVDFGHGSGMLPNGAGKVLRRRFGDCKDKAVLLCALLRALGVEAWPLLVGAGWQKAVARVQPSPAAFSHAIVTFVVEGKRHFVDPTVIGQGGDLAHLLSPPYGCGLEVRTGAVELLMLPDRPMAEIKLTETFHLDRKQRDGWVEQVWRATEWFADDVRAILVRDGPAAFFKTRTEALQKHFPALAPRDGTMQVKDDTTANTIELQVTHSLPTWGAAAEKPPAMFRYGAHGLLLGIEPLDGPEHRRQPWLLRHPIRVHHRVIVRGKCVRKTKPERYRVSGPGFRYECDVTARQREVIFDYRWDTTQAEIAPQDWPKYCSERSKAFEWAGANVATPSFWFVKRRTWLIAGPALGMLAFIVIAVIAAAFSSTEGQSPRGGRASHEEIQREIRLAHAAAQRGDFETAEPLVEKLRPYYLQNFEYELLRAETALNTGHYDRTRKAINAARRIDSTNIVVDVLESQLLERMGDLTASRKILDRVLVKAPESGHALMTYARVTSQLGDTEAARRTLEKILALFPANPEALLRYALLLWQNGEHERGDATIMDTVRAQPAPSPALDGALSEYFSATNRPAEAVAPAKRASELAPDDVRAAHRYAMSLARSGDTFGAVATSRAMAKRFPNQALAWAALGITAANTGENATASNAFQQWLKFAPGDPTAHANYGYFLHRIGRTADARTLLQKATRDFPGDGLVWMNYAVVLKALSDPEAAAAQKKAEALMPAAKRATLLP